MLENGQVAHLSDQKKNEICSDIINNLFAKQAFRNLLIAYKDLTEKEFYDLKNANSQFASEEDREVLEKNGLVLIGIYGLQDPLRPEIKDSVKKCHNAGITIRMVTGDNLETAKAIAVDAGILK